VQGFKENFKTKDICVTINSGIHTKYFFSALSLFKYTLIANIYHKLSLTLLRINGILKFNISTLSYSISCDANELTISGDKLSDVCIIETTAMLFKMYKSCRNAF